MELCHKGRGNEENDNIFETKCCNLIIFIFFFLLKQVEYFFASDASAIIEHTNRVIFLEDDDVAAVANGVLSIHRVKRALDDRYIYFSASQFYSLLPLIRSTNAQNHLYFILITIYF